MSWSFCRTPPVANTCHCCVEAVVDVVAAVAGNVGCVGAKGGAGMMCAVPEDV